MTKFTISIGNSVITTGDGMAAFQSRSNRADTLVVQNDARLQAEGAAATGAILDNSSAWTVKIDGAITSKKHDALQLAAGNTGVSTIDIGAEGKVLGGTDGILVGSAATIRNHGTIEGIANKAIEVSGDDQHRLINHGSISGTYSYHTGDGSGRDEVINSGHMNGGFYLGDSGDLLRNSGMIDGGPGALLNIGHGNDTVINTGTMFSIFDYSGNDAVFNGGLVDGSIVLSGGADTVTNFVQAGGRKVSGTVAGTIDLGSGSDCLFGGDKVEDYRDDPGSDRIVFAGGDDIYRAAHGASHDGLDRADGGKGRDTYDASLAEKAVLINLDSVTHKLPFRIGFPEIAAGTALGEDVAPLKSDRIKGFENVFGGMGGDHIFGSAKGNYIDGRENIDLLYGMGGNDHLVGGAAKDFLTGGTGADLLTGGTDSDVFIFEALRDSGTRTSTRDRITDFEAGADKIDLTRIDAIGGTSANDAFSFIGTDVAFSGEAGELRAAWTKGGLVVEADVNGDKIADFSIALDVVMNATLQASDFEL